ncbi:MAG: hypothetical protein ABEI97_05130, partial [Candidatus Nanohaloarchaea archaeon]
MERRHLVIIFLLAVVVTLPFLRVTPKFYTSDANVYFHTSSLLLQDQSLSTDERRKGWIVLDDRYYPAMPIGYSIFAIPFSSLFLLDRGMDRGNVELGDGFQRGPPDTSGFWMSEEATIRIESDTAKNALLSFDTRSFPVGEKRLVVSQGADTVHRSNHSSEWENVLIPLKLFEGTNTVTLRSSSCDPVDRLLPLTGMDGCASFLIDNFWVGDHTVPGVSFQNASFPVWVSNGSTTLHVTNPLSMPQEQRLEFEAWGYGDSNTTLVMSAAGRNYSWRVPESGRKVVTPSLRLPPNATNITFRAADPDASCYRTSNGACLRFGIGRAEFVRPFHTSHVLYTGSWYAEDPSGHRWASGPAGMLVSEEARQVVLGLRAWAGGRWLRAAAWVGLSTATKQF